MIFDIRNPLYPLRVAGATEWAYQRKTSLVETNGSGVCLIDFDNDGWLDIYLVNGATFDSLNGKEQTPHAGLFHNNHDGTFTEVGQKAGVANDRWGYGCSVADYDNDGWPDLFVGNYGKNRLYHNNHDGTFADVAEKAGVQLGNWSAGVRIIASYPLVVLQRTKRIGFDSWFRGISPYR